MGIEKSIKRSIKDYWLPNPRCNVKCIRKAWIYTMFAMFFNEKKMTVMIIKLCLLQWGPIMQFKGPFFYWQKKSHWDWTLLEKCLIFTYHGGETWARKRHLGQRNDKREHVKEDFSAICRTKLGQRETGKCQDNVGQITNGKGKE